MNNDLIISKTKNIFKNEKDLNSILIGQWLIEDFSKEQIEKNNITINRPASYEKEARKKSYLICENIFNSIIDDFCKNLNNLHSINLSQRAWRIIAESWIKRFIYICYNRKETLDIAFEDHKIAKVHLTSNKNYNFFTKDTEGQYPASVDNFWNSNLYLRLLNYFDYNVNIVAENKDENFINLNTYYERIKNSKKNFKFKFFSNFFSLCKIFVKKNDGLIFNSYLPFYSEKILEIYLKQIPQLWKEKEIVYSSFNKDLRNKIVFDSNKEEKNLENFIRKIIPNSLPICFVESFAKIFQNAGHHNFPKDPKFIFISTGFDHDELLKFYIAKNVEKGKKYYVGQHGATYFTEHDANLRAEVNTSDKFFSWGYRNNKIKNIVPLFNFKTYNKKILGNPKGNLLIIIRSLGYRATPWDRYQEGLLGIEKVSNLIKLMPSKINENTIIRLHKSFQLKRSKYFLDKYFGKYYNNLEFGNIDYKKLLSQSRLTCFNYDSTGFLENLNYNIPSVAIWDKTFNHLNENFKKKYELLTEANILFSDENKLINHIENYWENIFAWWGSKKVQTNINEFKKDFNNSGQHKDLKKLIRELKNE